jgi:hypothetical protein
MSQCLWNPDAKETGVYVCQRCTQKPLRLPPSMRKPNVSRACKNPRGPCANLGDETRRVDCAGCGGKRTQIKVFACAIHGECTIGKRLDGIACCVGCGDYSPA